MRQIKHAREHIKFTKHLSPIVECFCFLHKNLIPKSSFSQVLRKITVLKSSDNSQQNLWRFTDTELNHGSFHQRCSEF